tara:strand:- start:65 stop:832 length:768 start_codon:yes stop_codon:yes gene_type:complete
MLKKILRINREEGVIGFYQRIRFRVFLIIKPKTVKSAYGVWLNSNWGDATFNLCLTGTYGYFFSNFLEKIKYKCDFIDIGANQGLYSLIAGNNRNFINIYAIEPVNPTFRLLKKNIKLNNCKNIKLIESAISSKNGYKNIFLEKNHSGASTLNPKHTNAYNDNLKIKTINYLRLNRLIKGERKLIIKIDVEGHEKIVINQLIKSNFFKRIDHIFLEVDNSYVDIKATLSKFKKLGFKKFKKTSKIKTHYDILISR